jgi:hypothetical protein
MTSTPIFRAEEIDPPTESELASVSRAMALIITCPFFRDPDQGKALEAITQQIANIAALELTREPESLAEATAQALDIVRLRKTVECMVMMSLKAGVIMGLVIADSRAQGLQAPEATKERVN